MHLDPTDPAAEPARETALATTPLRHGRWYNDACGSAFAMEVVGERWSLLIVRELMLGARRFSEVRAALPALSAKVLSERLEGLEASGIVRRAFLPPPVCAQVYGLTAWGQDLEPVLQAMVRWSLAAPQHDRRLPFTPVSFMLLLRSLFQPGRAEGLSLWVAFDIAEQRFAARVVDGAFSVHPGGEALESPDLRFRARSASDFVSLFLEGGESAALSIAGDGDLLRRFTQLFAMPESDGRDDRGDG
ncbi:helix-turn-helix transcriptional regulator [Novosphingobium sp. 1949]|uniref:Helix-turn-helix transcriptional regulator n=1 Tax=Novosphingobium organovorum TaxID=2930092 RepID=A0ABT0B851_9SPHN|nr:helix-turn-helix domain-containing protein [Novosphingobium organovorum]MCJ2181251.1 helix-turn-helix transcriptional regulator [Novosphingobium organovorum]